MLHATVGANEIGLYRTPLGQKMIAVSPQLMQTSMQLMGQEFGPRLMTALTEVMQQQINQLQTAPDSATPGV